MSKNFDEDKFRQRKTVELLVLVVVAAIPLSGILLILDAVLNP